jgi:hypothetical protein
MRHRFHPLPAPCVSRVFTGLVALDSEGYVVWYYQAPYKTTRESSEGETYYLVFDWIPDSCVQFMHITHTHTIQHV